MTKESKIDKLNRQITDQFLKDGSVDLSKKQALHEAIFDKKDTDNDGFLSVEERAVELRAQIKRMDDVERQMGKSIYGERRKDVEREIEELYKIDPKDPNFKIPKKDFVEEEMSEYRKLDKNKDGKVTREEYGAVNPKDLGMLESGKNTELG